MFVLFAFGIIISEKEGKSMKKKLYMMRHGQTLFNKLCLIQGWCDSPLTVRGQKQARIAKKYFQDHQISFDRVICSTSERCSDTLEIVTNQPYERYKELKEMNFGTFEGAPERLLPPLDLFFTYFKNFGGETIHEVSNRIYGKISSIMEEVGNSILCVTHGGALRAFQLRFFNDSELRTMNCDNCAVFEYDYDTDTKQFEFV